RWVQRICQMFDLDWEVNMKHVCREENYCADRLANMAFNLQGEFSFLMCPYAIKDKFDAYVIGVTTTQLVSM
ncbi:hypothetical protein L195_g018965, partial [Trifolium pratense]